MQAVRRRWPKALIQFEDFAQTNATPILDRYRDSYCCFNDDIQGTAAVAVATMLAACKVKAVAASTQPLVIVGGGSAGCGIAARWVQSIQAEGLSEEAARAMVYVIDRDGLITTRATNLPGFQQAVAQELANFDGWEGDYAPGLLEVINTVKPGILLGVSGCAGLFSEEVVEAMHQHTAQPVILPLSNPSRCAEATPEDIYTWTNGEAIVACGSPFADVELNGRTLPVSQCNNSYIFPGIGLAVVSCNARRVTNNMLMASSLALAEASPLAIHGEGALLPPLSGIKLLSIEIAKRVAMAAIADGVAPVRSEEEIQMCIEATQWQPEYREYRRVAS